MRSAPPLMMPWLALGLMLPMVTPQALADDAVTIYRCTDAQGRLTLRDTPCAKGERQDTRSMLRPKDAPPQPAPPLSTAPQAAAGAIPPPPQVVIVQAPRPLYECVTPDDDRYLSDTAEGNLRWVPLWTLDYPALVEVPVYTPGQLDVRVDDGRVSGGYRSGSVGTAVVPTRAGQGDGTWVRDACYPLPQAEVCARLRDRRTELRRRFTIAQPSERAALGREERSIEARLTQDCR